MLLVWSRNFGNMFDPFFKDQTLAGTKLIFQRRNYIETFPPFYSKFDRYLTKFGNSLILFLLKKGSTVKYRKVEVWYEPTTKILYIRRNSTNRK